MIIGDDIKNLDPEQNRDVLFVGDRIAIGKTLFGSPINLNEVVKQFYKHMGKI